MLSRMAGTSAGQRSVYETMRQLDEASDDEHPEDLALDEVNLHESFHEQYFDQALSEAGDSQVITESAAFLPKDHERDGSSPLSQRPRWMRGNLGQRAVEEEEEPPESLLLEGKGQIPSDGMGDELPLPVPGPSTRDTRLKWNTTRAQQQLHGQSPRPRGQHQHPRTSRGPVSPIMTDPRELAMWRWTNVVNLDRFLAEVYDYFLGNGIWSILLKRTISLFTQAFVVGFTTFLTNCVDWSSVPHSHSLPEVVVPQCTKKMSTLSNLLIWLFAFYWILKFIEYITDIRRLWHMHEFYHHLLEVPDTDIQTVSWQHVVQRLMVLRDINPATAAGISARNRKLIGHQSKQRMDAHDIANRLMRKENYLIALFNKDVLDLSVPIPFLGERQIFSKTLEWNLTYTVLQFVFNEDGQVRSIFLKDGHRAELARALRSRMAFAAIMNFIFGPFIVLYFLMLYFFRYFAELREKPSLLGARSFSPLAEWKFREFNELWHIFERRMKMAYPYADCYLEQFPRDKTAQTMSFLALISGALAAVLGIATLWDPELFLGFEITHDRTALFYLSLFTAVFAFARGAVPEESLVHDPELHLRNVIDLTHYKPSHWENRLHTDEVRREVSALYKVKILMFLAEIASVIATPYVLWFSLPRCADRIVDFFREFTIHVDGLGLVCSFAVFDFKNGNALTDANANTNPQRSRMAALAEEGGLRDEYYNTRDGKMLASYYGFLAEYGQNHRGKGSVYGRHAPRRPGFRPPPTFPGLGSQMHHIATSPTLEGVSGSIIGIDGRVIPAPRHGFGNPAGTKGRRGPGMSGMGMQSFVLDPHHQHQAGERGGGGGGGRDSTLKGGYSMYQRRPHPRSHGSTRVGTGGDEPLLASPPPPQIRRSIPEQRRHSHDQDDEGGEGGETETTPDPPPPTESQLIEEDSELDGSWKTPHADDLRRSGGDSHEEDGADAGVLGLLYQFQKAGNVASRGKGGVGI